MDGTKYTRVQNAFENFGCPPTRKATEGLGGSNRGLNSDQQNFSELLVQRTTGLGGAFDLTCSALRHCRYPPLPTCFDSDEGGRAPTWRLKDRRL